MIVLAVLGGLSLGGCSAVGPDDFDSEDMEGAEQPFPVSAELDDLEAPPTDIGAMKLCTIWSDSPHPWRESFIVPRGWNGGNCNDYRRDQGASWYALTCLTDTGFQVGSKGGSLPPGNLCSW